LKQPSGPSPSPFNEAVLAQEAVAIDRRGSSFKNPYLPHDVTDNQRNTSSLGKEPNVPKPEEESPEIGMKECVELLSQEANADSGFHLLRVLLNLGFPKEVVSAFFAVAGLESDVLLTQELLEMFCDYEAQFHGDKADGFKEKGNPMSHSMPNPAKVAEKLYEKPAATSSGASSTPLLKIEIKTELPSAVDKVLLTCFIVWTI